MNSLFKSVLVSAIIALSLLVAQNARAEQSQQTTPQCCLGVSVLMMLGH